jgi:Ferritin-like
MIRIKQSMIDAVKAAVTAQDLHCPLQMAVKLELSTIPPYLTGLFTLNETGGMNAPVVEIMASVVNEEMLHMCIAANTLIALGGAPVMNTTATVPAYPGPLPGDTDDGLIVHLLPISQDLVLNTYMRIEEPDTIIQPSGSKKIPLQPAPPPPSGEFQSIGDFYRAIIAKLPDLPAGSIDPNPNSPNQKNQVLKVFKAADGTPVPAAITDIPSAVAALSLIVDQGEGSSASPEEMDPLDSSETAAHFYRFAQIIMGGTVVPAGDTYSFGDPAVTSDFSSTGVITMFPDPTLAKMKALLPATDFATCQSFSTAYTALLDSLNSTFNGNPSSIGDAKNKMFALPGLASTVLAIPAGNAGMMAGLCWELFRPTA